MRPTASKKDYKLYFLILVPMAVILVTLVILAPIFLTPIPVTLVMLAPLFLQVTGVHS